MLLVSCSHFPECKFCFVMLRWNWYPLKRLEHLECLEHLEHSEHSGHSPVASLR